MVYKLNDKLSITTSSVITSNTFPLPVESLYSMTYPSTGDDDIVQLTLILVSFSRNTVTLSGGSLGANKSNK